MCGMRGTLYTMSCLQLYNLRFTTAEIRYPLNHGANENHYAFFDYTCYNLYNEVGHVLYQPIQYFPVSTN
jgi:hypothetical protein